MRTLKLAQGWDEEGLEVWTFKWKGRAFVTNAFGDWHKISFLETKLQGHNVLFLDARDSDERLAELFVRGRGELKRVTGLDGRSMDAEGSVFSERFSGLEKLDTGAFYDLVVKHLEETPLYEFEEEFIHQPHEKFRKRWFLRPHAAR